MDAILFDAITKAWTRRATFGLLAGAAALIGQSTDTEARKRCPRCPKRLGCKCGPPSPTIGCRFGPLPKSGFDANDVCENVCGGPGTVTAVLDDPGVKGVTVACDTNHNDCVYVGCPLY